eukprot:6178380-Pleurochrysis_carterae.AAC.3
MLLWPSSPRLQGRQAANLGRKLPRLSRLCTNETYISKAAAVLQRLVAATIKHACSQRYLMLAPLSKDLAGPKGSTDLKRRLKRKE